MPQSPGPLLPGLHQQLWLFFTFWRCLTSTFIFLSWNYNTILTPSWCRRHIIRTRSTFFCWWTFSGNITTCFGACTCRAAIAVRYSIITTYWIIYHCAGLSGFVFGSTDMPPSICSFITFNFFNKSLPVCRALPWVRFHYRISGICARFERIDLYLPVFKSYRDFFLAGIQAQDQIYLETAGASRHIHAFYCHSFHRIQIFNCDLRRFFLVFVQFPFANTSFNVFVPRIACSSRHPCSSVCPPIRFSSG